MPKNKGKGGKNRRRGKNENEGAKRELILKEEGLPIIGMLNSYETTDKLNETFEKEYAQVQKMLGNGRLEAMCFDGTKRLCHIRGKLRKRQWINAQDIILVGLRDYQDQKADVIMKYNSDEARRLKNLGHLPDSVNLELGMDPDDVVDFMEDSDNEYDVPEQPYQPEISDSSDEDSDEIDDI